MMIDFNRSVQLSRPGTTAATGSACILREENEFADDFHGMRRKLTLLLRGNASVQTGDTLTYGGRSYEVVSARYCRDVADVDHYWRVQAVC